jgi:hypothetical protein
VDIAERWFCFPRRITAIERKGFRDAGFPEFAVCMPAERPQLRSGALCPPSALSPAGSTHHKTVIGDDSSGSLRDIAIGTTRLRLAFGDQGEGLSVRPGSRKRVGGAFTLRSAALWSGPYRERVDRCATEVGGGVAAMRIAAGEASCTSAQARSNTAGRRSLAKRPDPTAGAQDATL